MGQSIRAWIGLSAVVAVVVVVAGWFLLISPTRASTADARANVQSEEDRSIMLTKALDALKAEYASLDASKAKLDALTVQIPSTAETAEFRRTLVDRAAQTGVTILSISTDAATAVDAAAGEPAPAATTAPTNAASPTPAPTPSPAADAAAPAQSSVTTLAGQVLVGIPLKISVVGTYDAARAFIASLQTTEGRLFLVSGLGLVTQLDSPASSGRPATVKGDVEVSIQGVLLSLTPSSDSSSDSTGATASPSPSPTPLPSTERNPFAPVG